jgi:hypothetical protein
LVLTYNQIEYKITSYFLRTDQSFTQLLLGFVKSIRKTSETLVGLTPFLLKKSSENPNVKPIDTLQVSRVTSRATLKSEKAVQTRNADHIEKSLIGLS